MSSLDVTCRRLQARDWKGGGGVMTARERRSPAALVVEEEHEVELLLRLVLHLLADAQHVHGGYGDGHAVVLAAHPRHVGVDDLQKQQGWGAR